MPGPKLILAILLAVLPHPALAADAPRLRVPDEPAQAKAESLIRQLFKAEYGSNEPKERRALAKKLLQQAQDERTDAASRFVLFREARNVAASAGDVVLALRAVDEMNKVFAIDPAIYKSPIIQAAGRMIENQEDAAIYISAGISLLDQMIAARDFAGAGKLLPPMVVVAGQMKNRLIIGGVRNKVQYLKDTQIEFDRLKALMNKPGGDLANGKFMCFFNDDWDQGLTRLANTNDAKIKDAATKDLAGPKTAPERMAIANAWWEIAQKQTGIAKSKFEARARHWYRQGLPDAGGLDKVQAERRIASSLGAPEDATFFGGHAYTISSTRYGWNEAKLICELGGGHLAIIQSDEQWKLIKQLVKNEDAWLGATDLEEQGKWVWLDGTPMKFTAWHANEPNNKEGLQHYLHTFNNGWDDTNREQPCLALCEWE